MTNPTLSSQTTRRVTMDGFDGGLHEGGGMRMADNQLADAGNLWWKERALRTRPGLAPLPASFAADAGTQTIALSGGQSDCSTPAGIVRKFGRLRRRTAAGQTVYDAELAVLGYDGTQTNSSIATGMAATQCRSLMLAESSRGDWAGSASPGALAFIGQGGTGADGRILAEPASLSSPWVDVTGQAYVPLVMVDGQGSPIVESASAIGTLYEGFNLLTPRFRAQFTTTGENACYYFLPVKQLDDAAVIVRFTEYDGTVFTYTIPAGSEASPVDEYGIAMHVNRTGGYIYCVQEEYNAVRWFTATGIKNNLEVEASKTLSRQRDTICSMRHCLWFGSDRSGSGGGTRLFVAGHPQFPHLVYWSDVNNPLYFPENNYVYIGDGGQAVTAFARQGEKLVIFKEREMYYAAYTAGTRAAKRLADGTVIDATANAAQFPVTQLHPSVGCDCPRTIQLCDNRLVWADSSGGVYVLATANQYSETNVRALSEPIASRLKAASATGLRSAWAGDYHGHYLLQLGNTVYACRYTAAPFHAYAQNVTKSEEQSAVPWMVWEWDNGLTPQFLITDGSRLLTGGAVSVAGWPGTILATLTEGSDQVLTAGESGLALQSRPIVSHLQTKAFDFGLPERRKAISHVFAEIQADAQTVIYANTLTDRETTDDALPLTAPANGMLRLAVHAQGVRTFALNLECAGPCAIGGLVMPVTVYGRGVR